MYACYFIGHRDAPSSIQDKLNETVDHLVRSCSVTEFSVGNHGSFDTMATIAVQQIKRKRPEVHAYRLLYYHPTDKPVFLPDHFDDLYYPLELAGVPPRYAIEKANRLMLEKCDYLIAYVSRSGGSAAKILTRGKQYEKHGGIKVINLANQISIG